MFTPKSKFARNSSISENNASSSFNAVKRQNLYSAKSKSFFSPYNRHNKSLNVTELALEAEDAMTVENILTEFKSNLPLTISETLIEADKDNISGKIMEYSWLIIVYNQKLFIWNINEEDQLYNLPISYSTNCDLVVLDLFNKNRITCFSANRNGLCRFWNRPQAANSYAELQLNLQLSESCMCACIYKPSHILMGTSQGRMFAIDTRTATSISFHLIKSGGGILSGFSKRVSYLFGADNDSSFQRPIHRILCQDNVHTNARDVYVLTSESLQKWSMLESGEKMIYNLMLISFFETLAPKHLSLDDPENLNIQILDIIIIRQNIVIMVGINDKSSNDAHYALGYLSLQENAPTEFSDFELARFSFPLLPGGHMAKFRCIYKPDSDVVYFYNNETVACIKLKDDKPSEVVALSNIAAGLHKKRAMFLTIDGILIQIEETRALANASVLEAISQRHQFSRIDTSILGALRDNVDMTTPSLMENDQVADDEMARFKNAFIVYMKNGPGDAQLAEILNGLFPSLTQASAADSLLNQLVVSFSLYLIDDRPASDPRWTQALQPGKASASHSIILIHQLRDKLKAHDLFINFLQGAKLWKQLSSVRRSGSTVPTISLLFEHAEKLVAAMALSELHLDMVDLVSNAIEKCVGARGWVTVPNHLTYQDLFYKEVSRIDEILAYLNMAAEQQLSTNQNSKENYQLVFDVNKIFLGMLDKAYAYRSSNNLVVWDSTEYIYFPWTVSSGLVSTKTALTKQILKSIEVVTSGTKDAESQHEIWAQIRQLTDHLLSGLMYTIQQHSDNAKNFRASRREVLMPFVENGQLDSALFLAEKFEDFEIIIQVCEQNKDDERLHSYFTKLQNKGFADTYFNWCIEEGKKEKLFSPQYSRHPSLERFFDMPEHKTIGWLYFSRNGFHEKAFKILFELSNEEKSCITRKKTLLSLAKLNMKLSNKPECLNQLEVINNNLELILYQEQLADNKSIMENLGLNSLEEMRVYSPLELIEIYIGHYNEEASELDFKKAIDLLRFCDENDENIPWREILIDIWCKAILRDHWKGPVNMADIIGSCRNKIVFKLMNLLSTDCYVLEKFIPRPEELYANEMISSLEEFPSLQCHLMAMYEYLQRTVNM